MKIIVIGTRGFPNVQGGVETHCEHLYPYIVKSGCDVTVITRGTYVDASLEEFKGVKLIAVSNPKRKSLEAIVHTFLAVIKARTLGCDLLHIHAVGPALLVPFARLLGMKVVMTNHGPDYDRQKWGRLARFMLRLGESLGSRFSNKIISISRPIADNIKEKYKKEAAIIPNGVVVPEIMKSEDTLKKYGIEKGRYVLTVGRLVPEKGFHDLIEAFKNSRKNSWKLIIAGDADHEDKYSKELRKTSEGLDNVILTGRLTGKPLQELYSHAGLFVLPSYHEGLPIVLLEALSYGLSCIASGIPANKSVGILTKDRFFKAGDIKALSEKIEEFTQKPLSREEKQTQISAVAQRYDWKRIAAETLEVYRKAANS